MIHHFSRFHTNYSLLFERYNSEDYRNIFELLYLVFYDIRPQLEEGVCDEINGSIIRLHDKIEKIVSKGLVSASDAQVGSLGAAIREALGDRFDEMIQNAKETSSCAVGDRESIFKGVFGLVNSVMISGNLGVDVPYSIALRILGHEHIKSFRIALENFPVLCSKESTKERGSFYLGPRVGLEADIWCRHQGMDEESQYAEIEKMIFKLHDSECSVANEREPEIEFVINLLQIIGPQGRKKKAAVVFKDSEHH